MTEKIDCQEAEVPDLFKQYLQQQQQPTTTRGYRNNKRPNLNTSSTVLEVLLAHLKLRQVCIKHGSSHEYK